MKILFPGSFLLFLQPVLLLKEREKFSIITLECVGKDSHENTKRSETIKENAKGRGESLEKEEKER